MTNRSVHFYSVNLAISFPLYLQSFGVKNVLVKHTRELASNFMIQKNLDKKSLQAPDDITN